MSRMFSIHSLRNMRGVNTELVLCCVYSLHHCDVDITVVSGRRNLFQQRKLFEDGKTNTIGGSRHLDGMAVDLAPYIDGEAKFSNDFIWAYKLIKATMFEAAALIGVHLKWGATWTIKDKGRDWGHFEIASTG